MNSLTRIVAVVGGLLLISNVAWSEVTPAVYTCHISAPLGPPEVPPKDCPDNLVPGEVETIQYPIRNWKWPPKITLKAGNSAGNPTSQSGPGAYAWGTSIASVHGNGKANFSYDAELTAIEGFVADSLGTSIPIHLSASGIAVASGTGPEAAPGVAYAESSVVWSSPDGADSLSAQSCGSPAAFICEDINILPNSFLLQSTIELAFGESIGVAGFAEFRLAGSGSDEGPADLLALAAVDPNLWIDPEFTFMHEGVEYLAVDVLKLSFSAGVEYSGVAAAPFRINAGLNDAWYNEDTAGQGVFITVLPVLGKIFIAMFTFDTEQPSEDAMTNLGDPGHRWLTGVGDYDGNRAIIEVELTSGGIFFDPDASQITQTPMHGNVILEFTDCNNLTLTYLIPSSGLQGIMNLTRVVPDNIALCETLNSQ